MMMSYDDLIARMFSDDLSASSNMEELFLLYLGFYRRGLGDYVERDPLVNAHINVRDGYIDTQLGKKLAGDILRHRDYFELAIKKCRDKGRYANELCDFARDISRKIPGSFSHYDGSKEEMLLSSMSCMYAVTCTDAKYFSDRISKSVFHLLGSIFLNSRSLREAIVLQAISDEVISSSRYMIVQPSFFCRCLPGLRECISVLLKVLRLLLNGDKSAVIRTYENGGMIEKNVIAALLFVNNLCVAVPDIDDVKARLCYKLRHEYYNARSEMRQNPVVDSVCCGRRKESIALYMKSKALLMPYAVVDAVAGLIKQHGTGIVFTNGSNLKEYVTRLGTLRIESTIDFLSPEKDAAVGRWWFVHIMRGEAFCAKSAEGEELDIVPDIADDARGVMKAFEEPNIARGGGRTVFPCIALSYKNTNLQWCRVSGFVESGERSYCAAMLRR